MSRAPFLDHEVLERLGRVGFVARQAVESVLMGEHRSVRRGLSVEFAGHRPYQPGDDLRHLDWNVYARSDRYDVRVYEEETLLRATLVLDCSGSMGYRHGAGLASKLDYARALTAALAFIMLRQSDAVGLVTCDREARDQIPPHTGMGHLLTILQRLEISAANGETKLGAVLERLASQSTRRGLVVLVTDAFDDLDSLMQALRFLRHQRQEVRLFQVIDPHETAFPFQGMTAFTGLEGESRLMLDADRVRSYYLRTLAEHERALAEGCHRIGVPLDQCRTDHDLGEALAKALVSHRGRNSRA
jgi:uncharacterized protein (DUF58 family)